MKQQNTALHILRLAVTLLLIAALMAAALAGVNAITKDKIADIQAQKIQEAISVVLPGVQGLEEVAVTGNAGVVKSVYAAADNYAVEVAPLGFDGAITMMVGISGGKVTGISIVSHTETPGLGAVAAADNAKGEAFRTQFIGGEGFAVGENVDAMSGATITSKAVTSGVNEALEYVKSFG